MFMEERSDLLFQTKSKYRRVCQMARSAYVHENPNSYLLVHVSVYCVATKTSLINLPLRTKHSKIGPLNGGALDLSILSPSR